MLIKKCKAPTFAQNSALWCAHLCSQQSREDHQSKYLTLPAPSKCVPSNLFTYLTPLEFPFGLSGLWHLGEVSPVPLLAYHKGLQVRHQSVPFMKSKCPTRDLAIHNALERGLEVIHSVEAFYFMYPFSVSLGGGTSLEQPLGLMCLSERLHALEGLASLQESQGG